MVTEPVAEPRSATRPGPAPEPGPALLEARNLSKRTAAFTAPEATDRAFARLKTDLSALCATIRSRSRALVVLTDYLTVIPDDPTAATPLLPPDTAGWAGGPPPGWPPSSRKPPPSRTVSSSRSARPPAPITPGNPWTCGFHPTLHGGAAYHPTRTGMAAAAELITATILRHAPKLAALPHVPAASPEPPTGLKSSPRLRGPSVAVRESPSRRGAGTGAALLRTCHTVDRATVMPSPASSPWMPRYPHDPFSRASRNTTDRTLRRTGGRPERRDRHAQRRRRMS